MTGVDKITAKIISDAESDARARLAQAEAECEKIRADYESRAAELRDAITATAEHEAEEFVSRAKSSAAVEKRNILLNARSEMIDTAFDTALSEIRAWDDAKYRELLVGLVASAVVGQIKAEQAELESYGECRKKPD